MLAYQRPVDLIYLKDDDEPRWGLIKAVEPDVLVLTEDHSYSDAEQEAAARVLRAHRGRRAPGRRSRRSERIRQMYMHMGERLGPKLAEVLPGLIDDILKRP